MKIIVCHGFLKAKKTASVTPPFLLTKGIFSIDITLGVLQFKFLKNSNKMYMICLKLEIINYV